MTVIITNKSGAQLKLPITARHGQPACHKRVLNSYFLLLISTYFGASLQVLYGSCCKFCKRQLQPGIIRYVGQRAVVKGIYISITVYHHANTHGIMLHFFHYSNATVR